MLKSYLACTGGESTPRHFMEDWGDLERVALVTEVGRDKAIEGGRATQGEKRWKGQRFIGTEDAQSTPVTEPGSKTQRGERANTAQSRWLLPVLTSLVSHAEGALTRQTCRGLYI